MRKRTLAHDSRVLFAHMNRVRNHPFSNGAHTKLVIQIKTHHFIRALCVFVSVCKAINLCWCACFIVHLAAMWNMFVLYSSFPVCSSFLSTQIQQQNGRLKRISDTTATGYHHRRLHAQKPTRTQTQTHAKCI